MKYAEKHYQIVKEFGRYPYRNKVLDRKTTRKEEAYLKTAEIFWTVIFHCLIFFMISLKLETRQQKSKFWLYFAPVLALLE